MNDAGVLLQPITVAQARGAARLINQFMADWPDKTSPYRGARVRVLGGFRAPLSLFSLGDPEDRILWYVSDWDFPSKRLLCPCSNLLFLQIGGQIFLSSGDYYFLNEDLYPVALLPAEREGGVA